MCSSRRISSAIIAKSVKSNQVLATQPGHWTQCGIKREEEEEEENNIWEKGGSHFFILLKQMNQSILTDKMLHKLSDNIQGLDRF